MSQEAARKRGRAQLSFSAAVAARRRCRSVELARFAMARYALTLIKGGVAMSPYFAAHGAL